MTHSLEEKAEARGQCCYEWTGKHSYDCDRNGARIKPGTCPCPCHPDRRVQRCSDCNEINPNPKHNCVAGGAHNVYTDGSYEPLINGATPISFQVIKDDFAKSTVVEGEWEKELLELKRKLGIDSWQQLEIHRFITTLLHAEREHILGILDKYNLGGQLNGIIEEINHPT